MTDRRGVPRAFLDAFLRRRRGSGPPGTGPGPRILGAILVGVLAAVTGCRGDAALDETGVRLEVSVAPTPPITGPARIVLSLYDPDGHPVRDAELRVEGTMSHAGMVPVVESADEVGDGTYVVPAFEFTMGGDWILIVGIRLPDGREITRREELRVVSGGPPAGG